MVLAAGALLSWLSVERPRLAPVWTPWDFAWTEYLATTLTLFWYCRGLALTASEARPPLWLTHDWRGDCRRCD